MAVRTAWFLEGGGFDESYINGFEDVDLCMRAREEGRAIRYVADARFAHYEGASAGRFDRESENERQFYGRWHNASHRRSAHGTGKRGRHFGARLPMALAALSRRARRSRERPAFVRTPDPSRSHSGVAPTGPPLPRERRAYVVLRRGAESGRLRSVATGPARSSIRRRGTIARSVASVRVAGTRRIAARARSRRLSRAATIAVAGFDGAAADRKREIVAAITATAARVPALQIAVVAGERTLAAFRRPRVSHRHRRARSERRCRVRSSGRPYR